MSSLPISPPVTTREKILNAAARLFVERGFEATSVRDIANSVGISNPSLYYYFPSKAAILEELLAEPLSLAHLAAAEAADLSGEAKVRRVINGLLDALEVHNGVAVTALQRSSENLESDRPIVTESRPMADELLAGLITGADADLKLRMLVGAVESVVLEIMLAARDGDDFLCRFREKRDSIVELAMRLVK